MGRRNADRSKRCDYTCDHAKKTRHAGAAGRVTKPSKENTRVTSLVVRTRNVAEQNTHLPSRSIEDIEDIRAKCSSAIAVSEWNVTDDDVLMTDSANAHPQDLDAKDVTPKRPGKGSRLPKKRAELHKPLTIIITCPRQQHQVKADLENTISAIFQAYVISKSQQTMVRGHGESNIPQHLLVLGKLHDLVKQLELVTGSRCPAPEVLGGFLLGQKHAKAWRSFINGNLVSEKLRVAVELFAASIL